MMLESPAAVTDPGTLNHVWSAEIIDVPTRFLALPEVTSQTRPDSPWAEGATHVSVVSRFEVNHTETADADTSRGGEV